jgi:hypothetical protein
MQISAAVGAFFTGKDVTVRFLDFNFVNFVYRRSVGICQVPTVHIKLLAYVDSAGYSVCGAIGGQETGIWDLFNSI